MQKIPMRDVERAIKSLKRATYEDLKRRGRWDLVSPRGRRVQAWLVAEFVAGGKNCGFFKFVMNYPPRGKHARRRGRGSR